MRPLKTVIQLALLAILLLPGISRAMELRLVPLVSSGSVGSNISVAVVADQTEALGGFQFEFSFDHALLEVKAISVNTGFDQQFKKDFNNSIGKGVVAAFVLNNQPLSGADLQLAVIDLAFKAQGSSELSVSGFIAGKVGGAEIPSAQVAPVTLTGISDPLDNDLDMDGWTPRQGDCNDLNALVNPGVAERCNGADDNCSGAADEGFLLGSYCTSGLGACLSEGVLQCDSYNPGQAVCSAAPGPVSAEICDGIDNNCNGQVDDDVPVAVSGSSVGICRPRLERCQNGIMSVVQQQGFPAQEVCGDGIDQNCDGFDLGCDDHDSDGLPDHSDNCPYTANADQADNDLDGVGDLCDGDRDGDGFHDLGDNCPALFNSDQADFDHDGQGDACDGDDDNDGIEDQQDTCPNTLAGDTVGGNGCGAVEKDADSDGISDSRDNCPLTSNSAQQDADADGVGDACDTDDDNDAIKDGMDNCPAINNPGQQDTDSDGAGDACDTDDDNDGVSDSQDSCQLVHNASSAFPFCSTDSDGDGLGDGTDNCPGSANPGQADMDNDAAGDSCDTDDDGEGIVDLNDNCPAAPNRDQADVDRDGAGDICDDDDDNDGVTDLSDLCPSTRPGPVDANGCAIDVIVKMAGSGYIMHAGYRGTFSAGLKTVNGSVEADGSVKYYYTRTRMNFVSSSVNTVTLSGGVVQASGLGAVNGVAGYTFTATMKDGSPDSFGITIYRADGSVHYNYSANLAGGDLALSTNP